MEQEKQNLKSSDVQIAIQLKLTLQTKGRVGNAVLDETQNPYNKMAKKKRLKDNGRHY